MPFSSLGRIKMKRTIIMISLFVLSFAVPSFAERFNKSGGSVTRIIEGQVISIDTTKNRFVVKDNDDGRQVTIQARASDIAKLSEDAHVKVTLPQFGNIATRVK